MLEKGCGHLSLRHKQATAVIYGGFMDRITGLGSEQKLAPISNSDRQVSAQVADLISGEAARGIVVTKLLPGDNSAIAPVSTPAP